MDRALVCECKSANSPRADGQAVGFAIKGLKDQFKRSGLTGVGNYANIKNDKERNVFEGKASRLVHEVLPDDSEMICDPEFWIWQIGRAHV